MSKDAVITVTSTRVGDKIEFDLVSKHKNPKGLEFKYHEFLMTFVIDANKFSLTFVDEASEAFWVKKGSCPKQASSECDFTPLRVHDNGKRLDVLNANKTIADYHFALNFNSTDGPVSYDPIILNKNGIEMQDPDEWQPGSAIALAAAVVGAFAALFGLKKLFDRRRRSRH